ncbi:MAG: serine protease, partial [Alphaproteobacteria bacterium]|nr:serine protease [Alphaproteobacteria bacterium]
MKSGLVALLVALVAAAYPAPAQQPPTPAPVASDEARRVFDHARDRLVQIRTLALPSRAQASTGSGFVVGADGLVVSNYHVISQATAEKGPYALEWVGVDGSSGP